MKIFSTFKIFVLFIWLEIVINLTNAFGSRDQSKPVFFVASRGHHADIGGITPGSMPPHSKSLSEEGATFKSFFLIKQGIFRENELIEALMAPSKVPGSCGTRNLSDNLSDLKAQVASNQKVRFIAIIF